MYLIIDQLFSRLRYVDALPVLWAQKPLTGVFTKALGIDEGWQHYATVESRP